MVNPILQQMTGTKAQANIDSLSLIKQIVQKNPSAIFNQMMQKNPQFKAFVQNNRGKSAEQIAQEYGIDFSQVMSLISNR